MGRLTKDPEVRYTQNNMTVANFSIAVSRRFAKENDEVKADFFNVIAWNKTGEFVGKYFKKGQQILIAEEVDFAGSKIENNTNSNTNNTENTDLNDFIVTPEGDLSF